MDPIRPLRRLLLTVISVMREAVNCSKCGSSKPEGGRCPGCGDES